MQCSRGIKIFIYAGVVLCAGVVASAPFTRAGDNRIKDPQVIAHQRATDANFKKVDETSGIAIAGFRDAEGRPMLWAHNERTNHVTLISTAPDTTLYAGAITMPGNKTRDAEDIAVVHDNGKGTIYLEDAGANRKDMPVCVRYARKKENPSQCRVVDSFPGLVDKKDAGAKELDKEKCLARGEDWIWVNESDYLAPGIHPSIRRIPEPAYKDVVRARLAVDTDVIEFEYPRLCGDKPCREVAGNKMSDLARAYNTESLAVIVEPDHSHTAYLFTKAPLSLAHPLRMQRTETASCRFDSDGLSDVFRIRNIDALRPGTLHMAEYVTTLDLADTEAQSEDDDKGWRVTGANFLKISGSQGLLLVRTTNHAYKWPVALTDASASGSAPPTFDVAGALTNMKPFPAAVPTKHKKAGVSGKNQEAVAQLDVSDIYYMGECKRLPECSVTMVRDNHPYLPGDVDGNGRVDRGDVAFLRKFLAHEVSLYCNAAANVDGDDRITQADLDYLQRYVEGRGPAPARLKDRTLAADTLGCGYYSVANRSDPSHSKRFDQARK